MSIAWTPRRTVSPWSLAGLGAAGVTLSALGSWIPSLWGDEAASLLSAQRSLPSLFTMLTHVDSVHGLYYFGLHWWIRIFGISPFSLRFPSAIAVGFTVVAVTLLVSRLSSPRVAIAAGIICIILPRVTYMGEEARSYAFSAAIAAWLTYLLVETLRAPARWKWIAYAGLLSLGIYMFLYTGLLIAAHGLVLLSVRSRKATWVRWARSAAVALLIAAPSIFWATREEGQISYLAAHSQVTLNSIGVSLWFGGPEFAIAAWALILTAAVAAAIRLRHRRDPDPRAGREGGQAAPDLFVVAASWMLVPSVILISASFAAPVFTARYLSFCAPAAAILIACGLGWIAQRHRWLIVVGVVALVGLAVPAYLSQRGPYSKNGSDWAEVSAVIKAHANPGDAIAFDEGEHLYRRPRLAMHTYPDGFVGLKDVTLDVPFSQNSVWYDKAFSIAAANRLGRLSGVHRIWLVEYASPTHADSYDVAALDSLGFTRTLTLTTHRTVIYEYTRPATAG